MEQTRILRGERRRSATRLRTTLVLFALALAIAAGSVGRGALVTAATESHLGGALGSTGFTSAAATNQDDAPDPFLIAKANYYVEKYGMDRRAAQQRALAEPKLEELNLGLRGSLGDSVAGVFLDDAKPWVVHVQGTSEAQVSAAVDQHTEEAKEAGLTLEAAVVDYSESGLYAIQDELELSTNRIK